MLPTLALIKHEKTVDYVVGFDDVGGRDDFPTSALAQRLSAAGVLAEDTTRPPAQTRSVRAGGAPHPDADDEDSDFD